MELPGNPKTSGNFSLQWNGYESHLTGGMKGLLTDERLADVTLACEGKYIRAHKLILSLCSPYFKTLFELHNGDRGVTIVILNHVRIKDLENILCYAYTGQVQVHQSDLNSFLQTGELLQVEGLTSCTSESKEQTQVSDTGITNTNPETSRQRSGIGTAGRGDEASENSARNSRSRNSPPPSNVGKKNDDDLDILIAHTTGGNSVPNAHSRPTVHDRNLEAVGRSGVINYEHEAETFQGGIHEHSGGDEEKEVNMALLKDEAIEVLEIHDYGDHSAGSRHHTSELRMESQSDYLTDPIAVPSTSAGPVAGSSHQSKSTRDDSILTRPGKTFYGGFWSRRFKRNSVDAASSYAQERHTHVRGPASGGRRLSNDVSNTVDLKRKRYDAASYGMNSSPTSGLSVPTFPLEGRMHTSLDDLHYIDEELDNLNYDSVHDEFNDTNIDSPENRVVCPFCGSSFKNRASLKVHKSRKHRGMR